MIAIRPYDDPDYTFVRELFQGYVDAESARVGTLPVAEGFVETYLRGLIHKVRTQGGLFLVAESDGQRRGYVAALPKPTEPWDRTRGRVVMIMELHVREEARRQGIARRLLAVVERHFRRAGFSYATLGAFTSNSSALAFYDALGFRPTYTFLGKELGADE